MAAPPATPGTPPPAPEETTAVVPTATPAQPAGEATQIHGALEDATQIHEPVDDGELDYADFEHYADYDDYEDVDEYGYAAERASDPDDDEGTQLSSDDIDATLARFSAVHDQIAEEEAERRNKYSWLFGKRREPELGKDIPFDFVERGDSDASRLEWKQNERKRRTMLLAKVVAAAAALLVVIVGVGLAL